MDIRSVRKLSPLDSERTVPAQETLARAAVESARLGVTRLADITGLDRVGIPVHTAVVPKSDDTISTYNGKGVQPIDSKTGALMEAIERQTALRSQVPMVEGSYYHLRLGKCAITDPKTFNHKLRKSYREDRSYFWIEGYDLMAKEPVLVPASLAGYGPRYLGVGSPHTLNSSNGLASGNCFEEALCHALCELLERDAWTFAELRSHWIPCAQREALVGPAVASEGLDDVNACPRIDLSEAGEPISGLLAKFDCAGLRPVIRDITSELGICSVMASVADDSVPGFPQVHSGIGAHPNARIAIIRALTELAQSRAADIQAAREDLLPADAEATPAAMHLRRAHKIEPGRWTIRQAGPLRPLRGMASVENEDIADDIRLIFSRLARHGMERAIVVDFSEPGGFPVVRVLVPGLEFWALDQGAIGPRALEYWRRYAS
jgi:YcaO-like protein with predicted kinase domain